MSSPIKRITSGIQPSGLLHLGNYLGAIKQWKEILTKDEFKSLQSRDKTFFFIADLHSLTSRFEYKNNDFAHFHKKPLDILSLETLSCLIASGIDPKKCNLFLQSSVPQHSELFWILNCLTPNHWLNTMIQYKEKKIDSNGIFSYPVLMAADVLLYKASHVPVGSDQRQHIELIDRITERINKLCKKEIFHKPICMVNDYPRVMSLGDGTKKMSKSTNETENNNNCIFLTDNHDEIRRKIKKAKTDSIGTIVYHKESRPEISNLLEIYSSITSLKIDSIEKDYKNKSTFQFKEDLSSVVINEIGGIGSKAYHMLKYERSFLLDVLRQGEEEAIVHAKETLNEVKSCLGMVCFNSVD